MLMAWGPFYLAVRVDDPPAATGGSGEVQRGFVRAMSGVHHKEKRPPNHFGAYFLFYSATCSDSRQHAHIGSSDSELH